MQILIKTIVTEEATELTGRGPDSNRPTASNVANPTAAAHLPTASRSSQSSLRLNLGCGFVSRPKARFQHRVPIWTMEGEDVHMKLELCRSHIEIVPEGEADLAYIEDTLGLRQGGNQIPLIRLDSGAGRASLLRLVAGGNLRASQSRR
jgi:hypothetical protein